mgnify:CR=1 FL=1
MPKTDPPVGVQKPISKILVGTKAAARITDSGAAKVRHEHRQIYRAWLCKCNFALARTNCQTPVETADRQHAVRAEQQ